MRTSWVNTGTVRAAGTPRPSFPASSEGWKSTRKAAQQAPQRVQGSLPASGDCATAVLVFLAAAAGAGVVAAGAAFPGRGRAHVHRSGTRAAQVAPLGGQVPGALRRIPQPTEAGLLVRHTGIVRLPWLHDGLEAGPDGVGLFVAEPFRPVLRPALQSLVETGSPFVADRKSTRLNSSHHS